MSYILDALKKADAEREREGVPGLHAQHAQQGVPFDEHGAANGTPASMRWAAGGLAVGVLVLAAWWLLNRPEPLATAAVAALTSGQVTQDQPAGGPMPPAASAQPAAPMPALAPTATIAPMAPPPARPAPNLGQPPGLANQTSKYSLNDKGAVGSPSRMGSAAASQPGNSGNPNKADPPDRIVPVADLPEDVRRELPALIISGSMHSDAPANRMIVLNGGIFHEGDQPAPGLLLEEIKLKSAIFRFKGHRYSVAF